MSVGPGFPNSSRSSGFMRGKRFPLLAPFILSWSGVPREHIEGIAASGRPGMERRVADEQLEIAVQQQNLEQA